LEPATCADVVIAGKTAMAIPGQAVELPAPVKTTEVVLGQPHTCPQRHAVWKQLVAPWRAEATYTIEALAPATAVLIGFPVPTWTFTYYTSDGREDVDLPAVIRFETFIDGHRLAGLETRALEVPGEQRVKPLGYVWNASFQAGAKHTLKTTYDFGQDYSNGFYEGREYSGEPPWFLLDGQRPGATSLGYYLTPIRTWANPPPEEILVRVELPRRLPVTAFVPAKSRPSCVDEHALHYRWVNAFPETDLQISFPEPPLPPFRTTDQWQAWKRSLGGDAVQITCGLRSSLAANADVALKKALAAAPCVPQCVR
jgi:hypothetical protein